MSVHLRQPEIRSDRKTFCCISSVPNEYKCESCEYTIDLKVKLTEHLLLVHDKKEISETLARSVNTHRCENCDFQTHSLLVLFKHIHNCVGVGVNKSKKESELIDFKWQHCKHCLYKSKQRSNLKRHILQKHGNSEEIVWHKCTHCLYKTCDKLSLERHVIAKHTDLEHVNWFKCQHCTYKSKLSSALTRHVLARHSNSEETNWFKCQHCSFDCKGKVGLERHLSLQHDYKSTWLKCIHCSYNTPRKSDLKTHSVRMHPESDQIEWLFQTEDKGNLEPLSKKHGNTQDAKWLKCGQCSFQTSRNQYLKQHQMAKHVDPVLYTWVECKLCPYKNVLERNLRRHMARVHSAKTSKKGSLRDGSEDRNLTLDRT